MTTDFSIDRLYIRDSSFESPLVPEVFQTEWAPEVNIDLQTKSRPLDAEAQIFEVVLMVTAAVKNADKVAFCVEVQQAGIFRLVLPEAQKMHALGSLCPGILYPYAREVISELVSKGGFPPLVLAPVNFDHLYAQHRANQAQPAPVADCADA